MHSKELIESVKKKRASGASYGMIAQEMGLKRASLSSTTISIKRKKARKTTNYYKKRIFAN